ncbi:MAG: hypothetical protein AEth_00010 [Candidatus Argoarchaeum ethanivorans]|uniref:Uncharacterized protein n=1 Tax=Candidatus Argoarchaeum ethanivorans TaxID=2608793 RepID=A0A8B3S703_9EURY|nr:MAG: hypothetical protein AEth_00010 [Candidatus Argoarchaeum ethanivorans]
MSYGLLITETDAAEGIYKALKPMNGWGVPVIGTNTFEVLEFKDRAIAGNFYRGRYDGLRNKKEIRDRIDGSGICNCEAIFVIIGTGGGGSGVALEELKILLDQTPGKNYVNVVLVISEMRVVQSIFNTMEFFRGLSEIKKDNNLSITFISNHVVLEGKNDYNPINEKIAKWLVTEARASLDKKSGYDVANAIAAHDLKYSTVSIVTGSPMDDLLANEDRIKQLVSESINELWVDTTYISDNFVGIWLNAEVPGRVDNIFRGVNPGVDAVLFVAIKAVTDDDKRFESNHPPFIPPLKGTMVVTPDNNQVQANNDNAYHFVGDRDIKIVSRATINRYLVEDHFTNTVTPFLNKIWDYAYSGEDPPIDLIGYVNVASQQKKWKDQI